MDDYIDGLVREWEPEGPRGALQGSPPSPPAPPAPPAPAPAAPPAGWRGVLTDPARGAYVRACDGYLPWADQLALFGHCAALPHWTFDKPAARGLQRRGICMFGSPGVRGYRFSGQFVEARPMDPVLGGLLERVNADLGTDFNSWLLNWYRPRGPEAPGDCIGPHSDDERMLSRLPGGGLCVFGLTLTDDPACRRVLRFDSKGAPHVRAELVTAGGQAYSMEGQTQRHYTHAVPRAVATAGSRISLTARTFAG